MILKTLSESRFAAVVALLAGTVFYFSTRATQHDFDYTYRIALRGASEDRVQGTRD